MIRTKEEFTRIWIPAEKSFEKRIKIIYPEFQDVKFNIINKKGIAEDLFDMERLEMLPYIYYKFGVLYVPKAGLSEDDIYSVRQTSTDFIEFLDFLGDKILLKNFDKFSGGLDVEKEKTGTHSIFTMFKGMEIMYHVATMLPFTNDEQQIDRKRHIGNDVLLIIFKETDEPFNPTILTSNFNHVFVVVQKVKDSEGEETRYKMAIATKPGVTSSRPLLPDIPIFPKNMAFRDYFLTKCINLERVTLNLSTFKKIQKWARQRFIDDCAKKYVKI